MFLEPRTLQHRQFALASTASPLQHSTQHNTTSTPSHSQPINHHGPSTWRSCPSPAYCPRCQACARTRYPAPRIDCCSPAPAGCTDTAGSGSCSPGPWSLWPDGLYRCVSHSRIYEAPEAPLSGTHLNFTLTLHSGVAVGSSIGHAVGGWFGGGSSAPADAAPQNTEFAQAHQDTVQMSQTSQMSTSGACGTDVNNFRKCMDENQGSLTICGWYLDQLKACQQAAGQY
jgi:hypothetical protein